MIHDNDSTHPTKERRSRNLTENDIDEIVRRVNLSRHLDCRFDNIEEEDLQEAVKFYKNFNKLISDSGTTIWRAFLVLGLTTAMGLIVLGIYAKIKQGIGFG